MSNKKEKDTQNNSRVTQKLPDVRHKNEGSRKKTCSFYVLLSDGSVVILTTNYIWENLSTVCFLKNR